MERIAPLAKILAEANGIEWEKLAGTGAGGQIVEQDILDYLTRVMSGEAEPPSTPVDAPPPDWNGEDLPGGGMFDASALSKAGVESDIAEFVSQGRPAGPQVPGTSTPALSTDDFELDDAPAADLMAPSAPAVAAPTLTASPVAVPTVAAPVVEPAVTPAASAAPVAEAAPAAAAGGLGSLLSRLYHKDETPVAAPAPQPAPQPEPVVPVAPEVPAQVSAPVAPVMPTPVMPTPVTPIAVTPPAPAAPSFEAPRTEDRIAVPVAPAAAPVEDRPAPAPVAPAAEPVVEAPAQAAPAQAAPVQVAQPEPAAPISPVAEAAAEEKPAPAPVAEAVAPAVPAVPREAVWFGTYLRRHADVSSLSDLRGQLSEALERDVPLALLVARAAQRHAAQLGVNTVAMQDVSANQARSVGLGGGIRDAAQATDSHFDGTPDLLVVDAGTLDLDDLHYPHTVTLSVGRVQDGKASLSVQGDVDQAKAAQFLASVAQTLEKPVILLV